ncbi:hypothetical protein KI387_042970, partial [Taxus chinensis]
FCSQKGHYSGIRARIFKGPRVSMEDSKFENLMARLNHITPKGSKNNAWKGKISIFDGTNKLSVRSWLSELEAYLQTNPMCVEDALKFIPCHLEGIARDWWYHVIETQGEESVCFFDDFSQKIIGRFDVQTRKDESQGKSSLVFDDIPLVSNDCMWQSVEENPKLLGMVREQPLEAIEASVTLAKDESLTDIQNSSTKEHVFEEKTMEHEPKEEEKSDLHMGKVKLAMEDQFPGENEDNELAGISKAAAHWRQSDDIHDRGKNHEEVPCMDNT